MIVLKRIEKNKLKKKNRLYKFRVFLSGVVISVFLLAVLYTGLMVVDKGNRSILLLENTAFLKYNQIEKDHYKITFCGDNYSLNIREFNNFIYNTKLETKNHLKQLNIIVKNGGQQLRSMASKISD